ncbi:F0F1 ATP synthase subunit gamma [Nakamurella antarctica]|uniref:ATP synthase gamma chain n=1 Tax=Nakamurella antarctica TaxID=1902245 RepID=A0A3G8ZLE3_9ACTN|nr:F0F1 ATP synthase subunit gamma [Nakamurella antarctica]AZI58152.1 F0F1 ATP synthase subunit gamma [Nakamurella antarctica]
MAAQVRDLKNRERSVRKTQKITKAQELIATSRIAKAQAAVRASQPYSKLITEVLSALASASTLDHPMLNERPNPTRAGILLITSDRGLCGGYNANAIKRAEELSSLLRSEGKTPVLYIIGRKGLGYYSFRQKPVVASWTGFSEKPTFIDAEKAAETVIEAFLVSSEGITADGAQGIDELHLVNTQFRSMISQVAQASRIAPLEVEYVDADEANHTQGALPSYEFEPQSELLLDALLPRYVNTRIYAALLDSAASESAARRAACKSATDNANDIIKRLSREANQARQAQITQELSEIVGGADSLASAGSEEN